MRLEYRTGDLLSSGAEALVNTVNCVGVMGAGLAKQFAARYPAQCALYRDRCAGHHLFVGDALYDPDAPPPLVVHVATKRHWRDPSRLHWVARGARNLARAISLTGVRTVAVPPLGCGLGGLDWAEVRPVLLGELERHLAGRDVAVWLYAPPPPAAPVAPPTGPPGA
jgi:O-acetyl-ADP-ribose deacetylase (regulator of RNase III)